MCEMGGSVMGEESLWLRCRLMRRMVTWWPSSGGGGGIKPLCGEGIVGTTSALPSRDRDMRYFDRSACMLLGRAKSGDETLGNVKDAWLQFG